MNLAEAFEIVIDLAEENIISLVDACDNDIEREHYRQHKAVHLMRVHAREQRDRSPQTWAGALARKYSGSS